MKGMKLAMIALVLFSLVVMFPGGSSVASQLETCVVEEAGYNPRTGDVVVKLRPTNTTRGKYFYVYAASSTDAEQNRILAIALTALTNGWEVKARIDYSSPGEIFNMIIAP